MSAFDPSFDVDRPDVVVIGTGPGGAPVARRLVDAGLKVTVLEAGPVDDNPDIDIPMAAINVWGTDSDWNYRTTPQTNALGVEPVQPRGRTLGGTSALNGMMYVRGVPADYEAWALQGAYGWTWNDVEAYFRKLENYEGGPAGGRGVGGPMNIHRLGEPDPVVRAFVEAAGQAGHPYNEDYNSEKGSNDGAVYLQFTIKDGQRVTSYRGYVRPVEDAANLAVLTGATATRVLVDHGRAAGVEYLRDGRLHRAIAPRVVVSAGVFNTPQILQLSGIGDAAQLRALGVDVQVDLPGVGQNLQDHVSAPVVFETVEPVTPQLNGLEAAVFARTRPGLPAPDVQPMLLTYVYPFLEGHPLPENGFSVTGQVLHPLSRGTVRARSTDPTAAPLIDLGYYNEPHDLEVLTESLLQIRDIGEQPALRALHQGEAVPGPAVRTRSDMREFVRTHTVSGHHQVGTARMGMDNQSVVDPTLQVHGVSGLWIADASVMPTLPTGNTAGPTMMIGERAADFILTGRG